MGLLKMIFEEICFRRLNFILGVAAIAIAAAFFIAGPTLIDGYQAETARLVDAEKKAANAELARLDDETRKTMRDMGFNLLVVHRDTNMADFWNDDFSTVDMPQEYVDRLAGARSITLVTHLVATLQKKIKWNKRRVLLVGHLKETPQAHRAKKTPMGYDIEPGTVYLGYELHGDHKADDEIEILGETFRVARLIREMGSKQDITLAMHLSDAQRLLDKKGKINQILALGCRCQGERLPKVRKELEAVLPDTKITEFRSIALARAEQRDLVAEQKTRALEAMEANRDRDQSRLEQAATVAIPLVILVCAAWIGFLAWSNVRERRGEIGIFRALGIGSFKIGGIFLGKAIAQGFLGAAIGLPVGFWLAQHLGVSRLELSAEELNLTGEVIACALLGAPLISAMASYLPTLTAVVQDPADILRELQ